MRRERDVEPTDITHRLREVDLHARLMLDQRPVSAPEPPPQPPVAPVVIPVPRRARAYLFHGPAGARFAEVTLTAPRRRPTTA